jgi:copper transport protein
MRPRVCSSRLRPLARAITTWRRGRTPRPLACRLATGLVAAGMLLFMTPAVADAHAMLLSSDPAPGSTLASSPRQVRLVFSEALDASLDRMTLVDRAGERTTLQVRADPRDVHALLAPVETLRPGTYRVVWRVVSADGHVVGGDIVFSVGALPPDTSATATGSSVPASGDVDAVGPVVAGAPLLAVVLRGTGVGCLMALVGLLVLTMWHGPGLSTTVTRATWWLAMAAAVLLFGHLVVWLADTAPGNHVDTAWAQTALATKTGLADLAQCTLALLAVWALVLVRRSGLAVCFAIGALIASALIGHAATSDPAWYIPAKVLHLLAVSAWLGGLLLLLLVDRQDASRYLRTVNRVSGVALIAVAVVLVTGVIQTLLTSTSVALLLRSAYGQLVVAKLAGLTVLVAFGAYHRTRAIPRLRGGASGTAFRRAVGRETGVMILVVLLGGWLAYVAPPGAAASVLALHPSHQESSP